MCSRTSWVLYNIEDRKFLSAIQHMYSCIVHYGLSLPDFIDNELQMYA